MQLWIDNGDGNGFVDYTPALVQTGPLLIRRVRAELSTCGGLLDVAAAGLSVPAWRGRVRVTSDAGAGLFRGYVTREPRVAAAVVGGWPGAFGVGAEIGLVEFEAAEEAWLGNDAGVLHRAALAELQPAGSVVHAIALEESAVKWKSPRPQDLILQANDVTVTGARGAATYATELFVGDGTTATFALMDVPFREGANGVAGGAGALLEDSFAEARFATQTWALTDTGQHLGLGSGGLRVTGGNGLDGQTVLAAIAPVEMGGGLTAELEQVLLQPGSEGVLLGMYSNAVAVATCFAGFKVKGSGGAQTLVALVNGAEVGTPFAYSVGHAYTLRLRMHCPEMQRVLSRYEAVVDGRVSGFGGGLVDAPVQVVLEVQDLGLASDTVATVLYAGAVASSPAQCVFAAVNSVSLLLEAGGCKLTKGGSLWVTSTPADGTVAPRREGLMNTGADFTLSGKTVRFELGRIPAAGERLTVLYRRGERMVARMQDGAAIALARLQGVSVWPEWSGAVKRPVPRSAADCRAAAGALLAFGASAAVGLRGSCRLENAHQAADVWPGDRLGLPGATVGSTVQVPVERVTIADGHAVPEVLTYAVEFAQTEANGLSFATSGTVAADAAQPVAVSGGAVLGNLQNVQVVSATATALQVDAGVNAPSGGGFEVRRRDGGFGSGDADLVLLSPVRSFSIPRAAFAERFYVRMYNGSAVPMYSERSSVVVTHLPVS